MGGPSGQEEGEQHQQAARKIDPVGGHVQAGEGHVRRADLQGQDIIAESPDAERDHAEEDHDGAMHGPQGVVEIRHHDPARSQRGGKEAPDERDGGAGIGELPAHEHHEDEAGHEEHEGGEQILQADHLMVHREHIGPKETRLVTARVRRVAHINPPSSRCCRPRRPHGAPAGRTTSRTRRPCARPRRPSCWRGPLRRAGRK